MNNGKYSPELSKSICALIEDGVPNRHAANANSVSESTFYQWMNDYAEFSEAVEKAQAECVSRNVAIIKRAADRSWQAAAWYLERRQRNDFALKTEIQAEVKGEQTVIYKPEKKVEGAS